MAVMAMTGKAAKLINGYTVHSMIPMPIKQDGRTVFTKPQAILFKLIKNAKLIVLDEISLVGKRTLGQINYQLNRISANGSEDTFFGDKHFLMAGHFA